jgi:hypothetical protein
MLVTGDIQAQVLSVQILVWLFLVIEPVGNLSCIEIHQAILNAAYL